MIGVLHIQKNTIHRKNGVFHIVQKFILFVVCCSLCLLSMGCDFGNPTGDWEYEDLPNGYGVWRINSKCISLQYHIEELSKGSRHSSTIIPAYVSAVCNNDRYIAVRWTNPEEIDFNDVSGHDFSTAKYYVVDTSNDTIYGPYDTEEEYHDQCQELAIENMSDWLSVFDIPQLLSQR